MLVKFTLDPKNPPRLTPEQRARLDAMTEEEIEANALSDPDNPPQSILAGLAELGFRNIHEQRYVHKDKGKVLDLHFQKDGTDLFNGWKSEECTANLAALDALFGNVGITLAPRVMSLAEAYR